MEAAAAGLDSAASPTRSEPGKLDSPSPAEGGGSENGAATKLQKVYRASLATLRSRLCALVFVVVGLHDRCALCHALLAG
ncbi:hypothetical protein U9M48_005209 [Paspalum notatum var. saurae]|uniref:Uncharacterized protein n=1 Tax=Paspalum notatum var. saurae TaxID=547442 RepID=A0AAQ3PWE1_PASNO